MKNGGREGFRVLRLLKTPAGEGYGLQPVHKWIGIRRALAPEGRSLALPSRNQAFVSDLRARKGLVPSIFFRCANQTALRLCLRIVATSSAGMCRNSRNS